MNARKLLLVFLLTFTSGLIAQEREAIKQRAEKELEKATPEQIRTRIRELGITEREAEARAKELGIDLHRFLGFPSAQQPVPQQVKIEEQISPLQQGEAEGPRPMALPTVTLVPGFEGRSGASGLAPFGYNIFQYPVSTFEPILNLATPKNYMLGPGDEVSLTIWGETQLFHQLTVNREGNIVISNIGPVLAQGVTIEELRLKLLRRLTSVYSGLRYGGTNANTWLDVSLGRLRTIQIFVLGEVNKPGGYSMSSMSTAFHALYVAGGPNLRGTLREVHVLRDNKIHSLIDFYDYVIRGDKSKDLRLQEGDIVFVRPAGKRAALAGNVVRPAIFELAPGEKLGDLVRLAGGLQFDAYFDRVHIERVIPFAERKEYRKNILDIDHRFSSLEGLMKSEQKLEDGDIVSIQKINELLENRVILRGSVKKPGIFALKKGMSIKSLIDEADGLLSNSFVERANLIRLLPNHRREVLGFDLGKAMQGDPSHNLKLESEDSVIVYDHRYFFPTNPVTINGAVRNPGAYPRLDTMSVTDLVVLAGGLTEDAALESWEISRIESTEVEVYSKVFRFSPPNEYWSTDLPNQFILEDFDIVFVPRDPKYSKPRVVQVTGNVMFPGSYTIQYEGEKLVDIVKRAGGIRKGAYLEGGRFYRTLLGAGLVPIEFKKAFEDPRSLDNIQLADGDSIHIPWFEGVVYVRGEVFVPSAILYEKGQSLKYYLAQAGGFKEEADEDRVVVFLPSGKKWEPNWLLPDPEILPGSAIYVPKKIEKEDKTLPIIRDMATILASLAAITVALVQVTRK